MPCLALTASTLEPARVPLPGLIPQTRGSGRQCQVLLQRAAGAGVLGWTCKRCRQTAAAGGPMHP